MKHVQTIKRGNKNKCNKESQRQLLAQYIVQSPAVLEHEASNLRTLRIWKLLLRWHANISLILEIMFLSALWSLEKTLILLLRVLAFFKFITIVKGRIWWHKDAPNVNWIYWLVINWGNFAWSHAEVSCIPQIKGLALCRRRRGKYRSICVTQYSSWCKGGFHHRTTGKDNSSFSSSSSLSLSLSWPAE